ncbi:TrkH family potassium uptake protein [Christensenella intestinihominis]|uniref:TrkH family potassium uptake protein n=1 Tax=Christensenella intestinihominis TaxID=1851429 RepID=UPI00082A5649|nr:TrkH family potassium uptake protein [Christensenella intestinihominis]
MNRRMVLYVLCFIMRVEAVLLVPPLIIALVQHEEMAAFGFLVAIAALLGASLLTLLKKPRKKVFYAREGFIIVALAWFVVSVFGALPFWASGAIPNFIDSLFETVSGFTTTGASILTNVEAMPMSLLYWRSFTHWLGGMGVLVFVLAIMPLAKNSGNTMHILRAESPGPQVDKLVPRMHNSAKILYAIYVGMTLLQIVLLLAGGMPLFESVTTAFGTAGTGGFSVLNDSMASFSPYLQSVVTVFMILFGINFNIFFLIIMREYYKILRNEELWVYLGLLLGSILVITINVLPMFASVGESLHHAAFQVASIMTTTGFATVDFNMWPQLSRTILVILMVLGACAGSTGGGIKTARVVLLGKAFVRDVRKLLRPRSVALIKMNDRTVEEDTVRGVHSYLTAYILIALVSVLLISINNFSLETTVTSVVACMNNIGPGLDLVGPMGNYAAFSGFSKLVLSADMLIGRLEIFPMLMLLVPATWKAR